MIPRKSSFRPSRRQRARRKEHSRQTKTPHVSSPHQLLERPLVKSMVHAASPSYRECSPARPATPLVLTVTLLLLVLLASKDQDHRRRLHTRHLHTLGDATAAVEAVQQRVRWNSDYRSRLLAAHSAGRSQSTEVFLRWLHIPKTGTSFVNTLVRWGCTNVAAETFVVPRKERPQEMHLALPETLSWDWLFKNQSGRGWLRTHCRERLVTHHPITGSLHYSLYMHRALKNWETVNAVAFFRLPLQRMYSNYMHLSLHYNESREPRESLQSFLTKKQFWSQQTKMLLGRHYRDPRPVSMVDAQKAVLIVKESLMFVGLTEEFVLSCRLFHATFGGVPHRAQFENIRPGISRYNSSVTTSSSFRYSESQFEGWSDAADELVYQAAKVRFWSDVKQLKAKIEVDGLGEVVVQTNHLTNK
ncbi:unnamed protein product [Chondrus crispus]|uniref:Uncharacterized protein n=1 Tax=Chondrus crispus TaxID=2769 RepID=R7QCW4_CHOCR|nr:unnamed protein product [Chondrus crispus]CDF36347.1 unnamed protein product [Chondrus crispus]|eukprot:XP_005716166.1 unnamed protein product [Chondrus crispus]